MFRIHHAHSHLAGSSLAGLLIAWLAIGTLVHDASAQPPREDPGTPPVITGGTTEGWQVLTVPGLPAGAILGDVWADGSGLVYVWARYPAPRIVSFEGTPEGERLPGDKPDSRPYSSLLMRYDGMTWVTSLALTGETGVSLLGAPDGRLWATTHNEHGQAFMYEFNGISWSPKPIAGYYLSEMHTLAGVPGDLYLRLGSVVLHEDDSGMMVPVYEHTYMPTVVRGLAYLGGDLVVMEPDGMVLKNGDTWADLHAASEFCEVEDAWGARDEHGDLQLYAIGSRNGDDGLAIWRYTETDPVTHAGTWGAPVFVEPFLPGTVGIGDAKHTWGISHNEAYVAGTVNGESHLMRWDGSTWTHLTPPEELGCMHGVWGTGTGVAWFSAECGKLVRYQRANRPPDVTHAVATVPMLWPPNGDLVTVRIAGIVDPDDDAFTVTITNVNQNDDPALPYCPDHCTSCMPRCPDAVLRGGDEVQLRAEHALHSHVRVYAIEFTAVDRLGLESRGEVRVAVPHSPPTTCDLAAIATPYNSFGPCPVPTPSSAAEGLDAAVTPQGLEVRFALERAARVHLGVYDLAGRLLGTVREGTFEAGTHAAVWQPGEARPGVYFVKLRDAERTVTRRVVLLR